MQVDTAPVGFERYRERLLVRAKALHSDMGLSPRAELSPERLVEETFAIASRSPALLEKSHSLDLEPWLSEQLQAHTKDRWNDAVHDYVNMLTGYARIRWRAWNLPPQRLEAGDLINGAWELAHARHKDFRGQTEGEYVVWLQVILESHAHDEIDRQKRAKKRDPKRERSLNTAVQNSSTRLEQFLADPHQSSPSKRLRVKEFLARIYGEINQLPTAQRDVVVLKLQGLTQQQIADELDNTKYMVNRMLLEALERLRRRLKDMEGGA
jgi:RNA polymerase sigma-70 factor (ECF subfamily)